MILEERVKQAQAWEEKGKPSTWSEPRSWSEQSKFPWAEGLISSLQGSVTILDVGCYTGYFLREFCKRHPVRFRGIGVDIQRDLMNKLNGLSRQAGWPISFYHKIPVSIQVDVVTSFDTLEHAVNDLTLLGDMNGSLKPGGLMLIHLPQEERFDETNEEHLRVYTRKDLENMLPRYDRTITEGTDEHGRPTWRVVLKKPL